MAGINLMGPNPAQPFDIQTEQAKQAIAQKMAELLITQSMTGSEPTTATGGGLQMANWGEPIGKLFQGMAAQQGLARTQEKQAGLAKQYDEGLRASMAKYREMRQSDPVAAVTFGLTNQYPELRKIAAEEQKGEIDPKTAAQYGFHYSPEIMAQMQRTGAVPNLTGRADVLAADEGLFKKQDGQATYLGPTSTFKPPQFDPVTGMMGQERKETGKVQFTGPNVQSAFSNLGAGAEWKQVEAGFQGYKDNIDKLSAITQIESTLKGVPADKLGMWADPRQALSKFADLFRQANIPVEDTNFDVLKAKLTELMTNGNLIRKLAPVTETDVKLIQQEVGTAGFTKPALEQVIRILKASTERELGRHNAFITSMKESHNLPESFVEQWAPSFKINPEPPIGAAPAAGGEIHYDAQGNRVQ